MSKYDKYIFLPSFSLEPNKVTSYNSVFIKNPNTGIIKSIHDFKKTRKKPVDAISNINLDSIGNNNNIDNFSSKFHNYNISDNAYRTLKRRISWLYYLAKSKSVKTYTGKDIYNFKIGFITLTLPSKQKTCTADVTSSLLNPFLTELRQRTNMKNYIWRLEFQENGNVHYHLITDTYLDFWFITKLWNRLLKSKGYIDDYTKKFIGLNLSEYNKLVNADGKTDFSVIAKRYAKGKKNKWEQPNTCDVKSVISNKAISNYIAKYFSKDSKHETIKNEHDNEENSKSLRLWFCSRSLSKLKSVSNFCEAVQYDIFAIVSHAKECKKIIGQYATSYYFEIKSMVGSSRKWVEKILKDYSKQQGYIPSN